MIGLARCVIAWVEIRFILLSFLTPRNLSTWTVMVYSYRISANYSTQATVLDDTWTYEIIHDLPFTVSPEALKLHLDKTLIVTTKKQHHTGMPMKSLGV